MPKRNKKRLFVAMPYKKREGALNHNQPEKLTSIDFDIVWTHLVKPCIPSYFDCKRADEIGRPGIIDKYYIEWLYEADLVLADITFGNANVYYELGIRHALIKSGTILIAHKDNTFPFDIQNQYVLRYGLEVNEVRKFEVELKAAIDNAISNADDSPVHIFLPGLFVGRYENGRSPDIEVLELRSRLEELEKKIAKYEKEDRIWPQIQEAKRSGSLLSLFNRISKMEIVSVKVLEYLGKRLIEFNRPDEALLILNRALKIEPNDSEILGHLGFAYRKKGKNFYHEAEKHFKASLNKDDSNIEILGTYAGMLKRQQKYVEAAKLYKKAYEVDPKDLYAVIGMAGISVALGNKHDMKRYYQEIIELCNLQIQSGDADYWTFFTRGEACTSLGDLKGAIEAYKEALEQNPPPPPGHIQSTADALIYLRENGIQVETVEQVLKEPIFDSL